MDSKKKYLALQSEVLLFELGETRLRKFLKREQDKARKIALGSVG